MLLYSLGIWSGLHPRCLLWKKWWATSMPTNASSGWKGMSYISYYSSGPILAAFVQVVSLDNIVPFFTLWKYCQSNCALADSALPSPWILSCIVNHATWSWNSRLRQYPAPCNRWWRSVHQAIHFDWISVQTKREMKSNFIERRQTSTSETTITKVPVTFLALPFFQQFGSNSKKNIVPACSMSPSSCPESKAPWTDNYGHSGAAICFLHRGGSSDGCCHHGGDRAIVLQGSSDANPSQIIHLSIVIPTNCANRSHGQAVDESADITCTQCSIPSWCI